MAKVSADDGLMTPWTRSTRDPPDLCGECLGRDGMVLHEIDLTNGKYLLSRWRPLPDNMKSYKLGSAAIGDVSITVPHAT
jgi:hypothetical protein